MPRTLLGEKYKPNFDVIKETIRFHMRLQGKRFSDIKGHSGESYRTWTNAPYRFRIIDLVDMLNQLHIPQEEQEDLLLAIYRETKKRKV